MKTLRAEPKKTADELAEEIRQAARAAPALKSSHDLSMRAIVMRVADELEDMRRKGYRFPELAKFLQSKGVPIAAPTLATYLRIHRNKKADEGGVPTASGKCVKTSAS